MHEYLIATIIYSAGQNPLGKKKKKSSVKLDKLTKLAG